MPRKKKFSKEERSVINKIKRHIAPPERDEYYAKRHGEHYDFFKSWLKKYEKEPSTFNRLRVFDAIDRVLFHNEKLRKKGKFAEWFHLRTLADYLKEHREYLFGDIMESPEYKAKLKEIKDSGLVEALENRKVFVAEETRKMLKDLQLTKANGEVVEHSFTLGIVKRGENIFLTFKRGGSVHPKPILERQAHQPLVGLLESKALISCHTHPYSKKGLGGPSKDDFKSSRSTGIPFLVVQPTPTGGHTFFLMVPERPGGEMHEDQITSMKIRKKKRRVSYAWFDG